MGLVIHLWHQLVILQIIAASTEKKMFAKLSYTLPIHTYQNNSYTV